MSDIIEEQQTNSTNLLLNSITDAIKTSSEDVQKRVKDFFVEKELKKRSDLFIKAFVDIETTTIELKKNKPDVEQFDSDGNSLPLVFSKNKYEERKKLQKKIKDITDAINIALDNNDFSKLTNMYKDKS